MTIPTKNVSVMCTKFTKLLAQEAWTLTQVSALLREYAQDTQDDSKQIDVKHVCMSLLHCLNAVPHVGTHATGRRYNRLQFIENALSLAGLQFTRRDFEPWFLADSTSVPDGDWQPDALLPYAPEDRRLLDCEEQIDNLEHALHQTQVALNRSNAELRFVSAERKHFFAVAIENIHKLVKQDFEKSTSWRVTKPLRTFSAFLKGAADHSDKVDTVVTKSAPMSWDSIIPPWDKLGYSTEVAWRGATDGEFDRHDYTEWRKRYDLVANDSALFTDAKQLAQSHGAPLISMVLTINDEPLELLQQSLASIQAQSYIKWEVCIAFSSRTSESVREWITSITQTENRIKSVYAQADKCMTFEASLLATGHFIGFLSATDLIASQAIYMLAKAIFSQQNLKVVYADSDKLNLPDFARSKPDFKPDWNIDLFYSQDYTRDLCFYSKELIADCGGFSKNLQSFSVASFDMTLRAIGLIDASEIYHIPQVLVHLRVSSENSADDVLYHVQTLNEHFARTDQKAHAMADADKWDIHFGLPTIRPLVSLIIPTKNNLTLLRQCVSSILSKTNYDNFEIIVIDNGSDQNDTLDYLRTLSDTPKVRVIRDNYSFNYSALNNSAVTFAKGEIIALVNDDIEVKSPNWLSEMVSHALRPGVGAVGARLWYPDMKLQHAGIVLAGGVARHVHKFLPVGDPGFNGRAVHTQNFSAVTGASMVVKKSLFESVGGFNEKELAIGFNDVDFCLRLVEAGYRNVWTPRAELFHHESATRGEDDAPDKQRRAEKEYRYMRKRWGSKMDIDPAYNPNLSSGHDDFSLAWP